MSDEDIFEFFSGPAFQPWNRFGNVKGTWGPERPLSMAWVDQQFALQKQIVSRMVQLGITPILPAFPGFVPDQFSKVRPNASLVRAPAWGGYPEDSKNTHTLFLDPLDESYAELQKLFVENQIKAYGNITNMYAMDQFNEINPVSGDANYLARVSESSYAALTAANPAAVWIMQGWLFYIGGDYWTQERIDAYLSGPQDNAGLVMLDLFGETAPQWQRTKSYAGRPWIWCQVHDFGGNQNLYGKITNTTVNPMEAQKESGSMVGLGIAAEGFEGNEVIYDLFFDQAWSKKPIDTASYFHDWTTKRYSSVSKLPSSIYKAWELLRLTVYDYKESALIGVPVSVYQLQPNVTGLYNITAPGKPTALHYDPEALKPIWGLMLGAAIEQPLLWRDAAYRLDLVDVTRQVMSNAFGSLYVDLVSAFEMKRPASEISQRGEQMLALLRDLDALLSTQQHFRLQKWLEDAKVWGESTNDQENIAYNARSQVTIWAPDTLLNDYAAKAWSGLISTYYSNRWSIFIKKLVDATENNHGVLNFTELSNEMNAFQISWQTNGYEVGAGSWAKESADLQGVVESLKTKWQDFLT